MGTSSTKAKNKYNKSNYEIYIMKIIDEFNNITNTVHPFRECTVFA